MHEGCFDIRKAGMLDSKGRVAEVRPLELLQDIAGVNDGMVCVDFGAGSGTFALPMAKLTGARGKVYAVDRSPDMLGHLKEKHPPVNLILVQSDVTDTGLKREMADFCLLASILHEVKQPDRVVIEASHLLKTKGSLLVMDWKAELDSPGPPQRVRISRSRLEQMFRDAGISLIKYLDWSPNYFVATGRKIRKNNT